jgi:hypothetical protein
MFKSIDFIELFALFYGVGLIMFGCLGLSFSFYFYSNSFPEITIYILLSSFTNIFMSFHIFNILQEKPHNNNVYILYIVKCITGICSIILLKNINYYKNIDDIYYLQINILINIISFGCDILLSLMLYYLYSNKLIYNIRPNSIVINDETNTNIIEFTKINMNCRQNSMINKDNNIINKDSMINKDNNIINKDSMINKDSIV